MHSFLTGDLFVVWFFLKKRLNMSSLIANKVKTNMCLVSLSLYCSQLSYVPLFPTYTTYTTIITTTTNRSLFFFFFSQLLTIFFVSTNTCSLDLYSGDLQTTTVLFTRNVSSHNINWITTHALSVFSCRCPTQSV